MNVIGQSLHLRRLGYAVLLLLMACGRPATANVTDAQPEPTVVVESPGGGVAPTAASTVMTTTSGAAETPVATMVASTAEPPASAPEQTPTMEEQVMAVPTQNAAILKRAREQGSVRIIVTLALPWQPEGELPDEAVVMAQRKAIADAQAALTARLASYNVTDITSFQFIPSMVMVVDVPALQTIIDDPAVESIQEDGLASPSLDAPAAPSVDEAY
ncbi:MAG: hypothetical protein AVDCRST_MAG93-9330 [uncultured Chloroflexia bacterium]|uniref:Inhibitor I9 domain-containing protein n=1 Tax=uncultured Chloroflexia bacterium TaxID=1672391 RepID=A0A6J4NBI1_9CHLR|nr:MAG: hypothetical protein AVDCRST_MAG93-9330 [uncultured Chloroflexia bacterium]